MTLLTLIFEIERPCTKAGDTILCMRHTSSYSFGGPGGQQASCRALGFRSLARFGMHITPAIKSKHGSKQAVNCAQNRPPSLWSPHLDSPGGEKTKDTRAGRRGPRGTLRRETASFSICQPFINQTALIYGPVRPNFRHVAPIACICRHRDHLITFVLQFYEE